MANRLTTAQFSLAMRHWGPPAIVALAAMAALTVLTADAAARQARPAVEATAPREAGEPIMAIVSIESQQVTFYDADGWILRAPVSTGVTGRETPAGEAKLALEPVSVYISRATQKLYVRRNTHKHWPDGGEVFDASIEVPVTIRNPDKRIGTHVFTAMARNNAGLRWTAVTIDDGDDAKAALDRINIPQDVLDRIAPTALPRSSIIVSDEPLSRETNYRTEFVAVLSDQPQGGFVTRRPTADPPVWGGNNWGNRGFGNFFQRGWAPQRPRTGQYYQPMQQRWW